MKKKKKISIKFLEQASKKKIILKILYVIICILIVLHLIILLNTTIKRQEYFSLFGFNMIHINDSMMEPNINKNDLIIATSYEEEIEENDIVCYYNNERLEVSKIINKKQNNGKIAYVTKLDNAYYPTPEEITEEQIIGKVQLTIPFLGILFDILKSKITIIILIIVLILKFSYNKYMYKQTRKRKGKKILKNY